MLLPELHLWLSGMESIEGIIIQWRFWWVFDLYLHQRFVLVHNIHTRARSGWLAPTHSLQLLLLLKCEVLGMNHWLHLWMHLSWDLQLHHRLKPSYQLIITLLQKYDEM